MTGKEVVGKVTIKHVYEIAKIKQQDYEFQLMSLKQLCQSIIGNANSIGIEVSPLESGDLGSG